MTRHAIRKKLDNLKIRRVAIVVAVLAACGLLAGLHAWLTSSRSRDSIDLRVFHAAGMTSLIEEGRRSFRREAGIRLRAEGSGSQVACRKVAELGRTCDLLMLADRALVEKLLDGVCTWRLDFAADEVVLGVGQRAPRVPEAEQDWVSVLRNTDVRLGRVDENQGPIGYRTLLVWKLQAQRGSSGLTKALREQTDVVVDHVSRLPPLLNTGQLDYAFLYRSVCIANDVRYIALDEKINLGSPDMDYSGAEVTFEAPGATEEGAVTMRASPIVWTMTIPQEGADREAAVRFIRYLLEDKSELLKRNGFRPLKPARYYGAKDMWSSFRDIADYRRKF
mgnify:CR=1 FL=1